MYLLPVEKRVLTCTVYFVSIENHSNIVYRDNHHLSKL